MDEEIAIIDTNTRFEKFKNFLKKNYKKILSFLILIIIIVLSYFGFNEFKDQKRIKISNLYNSAIIGYSQNNSEETKKILLEIIQDKNPTYSPLSLYFIIDNEIITNKDKINELFNFVINEITLEKEIKNLIIYKKALFNADFVNENELLNILGPIINSESVWKSQALYLAAEYFFSKNEKQKSKEFFIKIIDLENGNSEIKIEAQKRINRDLSD
tara:strand:- start:1653 stop:2297 length:645 start_codon:yes stop_codon:yes gene_type:complete